MKTLTILLVATLAVGLAAELTLIQPAEVAAQLVTKGARPVLFHVGPNLLYRGKHIPGSIYAGPGSRAEGLEALKVAAGRLPRDREIVLYCGCCPCLLYTSPSPRDGLLSRMPSSA